MVANAVLVPPIPYRQKFLQYTGEAYFHSFHQGCEGTALIIKRFHTDLKGVPHGLRHGFGMLRQDRVKTGICRRVVLSFKRFQRPRAAHLFWAVVDQDHLQHHKASEQEHAKDK